jgi:hypothetical protein
LNKFRILITLAGGETREFKVRNPMDPAQFAAALRNQLILEPFFMISCDDTPLDISIFQSKDVSSMDVFFHQHLEDVTDGDSKAKHGRKQGRKKS